MLRIILVLFTFSLVFSIELEKPYYNIDHANYYFNDFIDTYNKQYPSEMVKQERLKIFTENLKKINIMNNGSSAVYGINQFADLTVEEFRKKYTGLNTDIKGSSCQERYAEDIVIGAAPDAFDWRDQKMVSPVKNQGGCGSCYAFSSIGNIESQYAIKNNGKILDLSEEQLVDCSQVNLKCDGGYMTQCMTDIIDAGGIASEANYPYVEGNSECRFKPDMVQIKLSGCIHYNIKDENQLKEVLYRNGPISIAVAAAQAIIPYHKGIIHNCPGPVDHAVLLVGYGSENGKDFWIIKNSWGTNFGEQGYFRMLRGSNMCSLLNNLMASAIV